ncbi:MAG: CBS domain-containing protein [Clostridia bacterium]|nr:CBS domain-containing protein [Clostridia bacterium]MBQ8235471.1 CBS domain-containing protein [Clostridia bacterium]MBQ8398876.1 CBS domain-containing protein [Clostridia bacterium]
MNVAFFIKPKSVTAFVYEDNTLRQGLEKMRHHGYSAIPVLTRDGKYAGSVSEGDFLWAIYGKEDARYEEKTKVREILKRENRDPVRITAGMDDLLHKVMTQNYVSVVDDSDSFIGIVTRRDIMRYYYEKIKKLEEE